MTTGIAHHRTGHLNLRSLTEKPDLRQYYDDEGYAYAGDVAIQGAGQTAFATIDNPHDGSWNHYSIPLDSDVGCWSVDALVLQAILEDVTGLEIRAEYRVGEQAWLDAFAIE